jgi:hypothetical protein
VERLKGNVATIPKESAYFEEFNKVTLKQHNELNKEYKIEQLLRLIEEHGSMYGLSS